MVLRAGSDWDLEKPKQHGKGMEVTVTQILTVKIIQIVLTQCDAVAPGGHYVGSGWCHWVSSLNLYRLNRVPLDCTSI